MNSLKSQREEIYSYIKKIYNISPEFLWQDAKNFAVFRNKSNKKWFAIIMDIPASKLGLAKKEIVDVLNVKISDWFLKDILLSQSGFFPAYHMNKNNWISILLDGSVSLNQIEKLLDGSYVAVGIKNKNKKAE